MKFKRLIIYILTLIIILAGANISFASEDIHSESAILIDSTTGKTLYEKNSTEKMYPASTTKILTSIIAIEKGNLDDKTTVKRDAIAVIPSGYSSAYLSEGEEITIKELLEVFLVHSANEAGNVLAEYISGSIDEFVNLMNQKASELGCEKTHFVNTNGIHNENHYTTAKDLAIIARYCMQNQTFREIVSMKSCTIPKTNKSDKRFYKNTNDLINPSSPYYLSYCIGIKTGYTSQAKNCLISACNKDGLELIAVVLGAPNLPNRKSARYIDSITLYNYGYSNYKMKQIASKGDVVYNIDVNKGSKETKNLDLVLGDDVKSLVNINDENVTYSIDLEDNIEAPISANSNLGTITYTVGDSTYSTKLLASHDVYKNDFTFIIGIILALILILILSIILILIKNKKK